MKTYFEYQHIVTSQEIDELKHAGNYQYIKWMQHAAIAHSTANGWSPQKYEQLGAGWMVRSHHITYLKPAFEGDSITIKTWVSNMRPATSLRHYEIRNDAGLMLAKAETDWAFVNYEKQKPTRIPGEVASCFAIVTD
jgi:acyl-CoA thioester hydrolase